MKNIVLIHAPIDSRYLNASTLFAPSLGLLSIKSYLESKDDAFEVTILDGMIMEKEKIIDELVRLKPDFVGLSIQLCSYKIAVEIARVAKGLDACVFMGGHHATHMAPIIMQHKSDIVDCIICRDGEVAAYAICSEVPFDKIENIVFYDKRNGKVIVKKRINLTLSTLPNPYLAKDIDYAPYTENLRKSKFKFNKGSYYRIYSHKGCAYRKCGTRCVFCGRADVGYRFTSIKKYFEYFTLLNIGNDDFVFDVGDDLLGDVAWINRALKFKERHYPDTNFNIGIFGRGDEVDEDSVKLLKKLGVCDITIGVESGDDLVLRTVGKSKNAVTTADVYIDAAKILFSNGISMTPSYVFGVHGESPKSIENTINHAKKLNNMAFDIMGEHLGEIVANLIEPLPGSRAFEMLKQYYPDKYEYTDELDWEEMQKDYFSIVLKFRNDAEYKAYRKTLSEAGREINELTGFADSQGWLKEEMSMGLFNN